VVKFRGTISKFDIDAPTALGREGGEGPRNPLCMTAMHHCKATNSSGNKDESRMVRTLNWNGDNCWDTAGPAIRKRGAIPGASIMMVTSKASEPNAKLVLNALETVFNQHKIEAVDEFFSEDFVQHSPYVPPGGRKELADWWQRTVEAMPDVHGTVEHLVAANDSVTVFRKLKGTIRKDMPEFGIKAHNQKLEFRVAHLFQVADGKIVGHWEILDSGPATQLAIKSM
jgi:predicted SnoaL-like aldol condensation-catalyzing enzyme